MLTRRSRSSAGETSSFSRTAKRSFRGRTNTMIDLTRVVRVLFVGILIAGVPAWANTIQLITNGGFETSDFTGWTVTSSSVTTVTWSVSSSTVGSISGFPTPGPSSGSFYAVADQNGATVAALEQSFTVLLGATSLTLSFDMFVNDWNRGGSPLCGNGLTISAEAQCARVDVLTSGATP